MDLKDYMRSLEGFREELKREGSPTRSSRQRSSQDNSARQTFATGGDVKRERFPRGGRASKKYSDDEDRRKPRRRRHKDREAEDRDRSASPEGRRKLEPMQKTTQTRKYKDDDRERTYREEHDLSPLRSNRSTRSRSRDPGTKKKLRSRSSSNDEGNDKDKGTKNIKQESHEERRARRKIIMDKGAITAVQKRLDREARASREAKRKELQESQEAQEKALRDLEDQRPDSPISPNFYDGVTQNFGNRHLIHVPTKKANNRDWIVSEARNKSRLRQGTFNKNTIIGLSNEEARNFKRDLEKPAIQSEFAKGVSSPARLPITKGRVIDIADRSVRGPYADYIHPKDTGAVYIHSYGTGDPPFKPHHLHESVPTAHVVESNKYTSET